MKESIEEFFIFTVRINEKYAHLLTKEQREIVTEEARSALDEVNKVIKEKVEEQIN